MIERKHTEYHNVPTNAINKVIVQAQQSIRSIIDYNINITFVMDINIHLLIIQDKFRLPETIERSLLRN